MGSLGAQVEQESNEAARRVCRLGRVGFCGLFRERANAGTPDAGGLRRCTVPLPDRVRFRGALWRNAAGAAALWRRAAIALRRAASRRAARRGLWLRARADAAA